jgi:hypothetical protein
MSKKKANIKLELMEIRSEDSRYMDFAQDLDQ